MARGVIARSLSQLGLGLVTGTFVALSASPAQAIFYSGAGAESYAHTYACNGIDCRNSDYYSLDADCANFVSQALHEGGGLTLIENGNVKPPWFYHSYIIAGSPVYYWSQSWVSASGLYSQLRDSDRLSSIANPTMNLRYSGANPGDIYLYDWGRGEGFSHVSLATSSGNFYDYSDSSLGINYKSVTSGYGSRMAQHSPDRDWAPWNLGYWAEASLFTRTQMKTKILRIAPAN
jgi:hypothetical protein